LNLHQGNTYELPIKLTIDGTALTSEDVTTVEVSFETREGVLIKKYPDEATYNEGAFIIPLTQEETFAMSGNLAYKARVLLADGKTVKCTGLHYGNVLRSISKVVLE
jgi:hypothetical protein